MKCPHCGIYFEDGERHCPICGCRTGSFAPKHCREKSSPLTRERKIPEDPTFTQKTDRQTQQNPRPTSAPPFFSKPKPLNYGQTSKNRGCVVCILVVVLVLVITTLVSMTSFRYFSEETHNWSEPATPEVADDYTATFYGSYASADGASVLTLDGDNNFTLLENGQTYTGYYDVSSWDFENYNENYAFDSYTGYELYLSFDSGSSPMISGDDYAFYEAYILDSDTDILTILDYNGTGYVKTFTCSPNSHHPDGENWIETGAPSFT